MRNAPPFLLLISFFNVINALQVKINPNPVVTNGQWSLAVQRESNDPAEFLVSLLFNNQPASDSEPLVLRFTNQNVAVLNSDEAQAPELSQAGSYAFVATPPGASPQQTFSFAVVDSASPTSIQTNAATRTAAATAASSTQTRTLTQAPTQTSSDHTSQSSINQESSASNGSSSNVSSTKGSASVVSRSSPIASAPGSGISSFQTSPAVSVEDLSSSTNPVIPETSSAFTTRTSSHRNQSGPVAGGVVGGVLVLMVLFTLFLWYQRRRRAAKHAVNGRNGLTMEPYMLEVPASTQPSPIPGSSKGVPYISARERSDSPNSEDSRSSTAIKRQMQLREQEKENSRQMADLEARTRDSSQWVSRAEYEAELGRLRAEVEWLRDIQQSDWAMGLSDEIPPAYQRNSATNSP